MQHCIASVHFALHVYKMETLLQLYGNTRKNGSIGDMSLTVTIIWKPGFSWKWFAMHFITFVWKVKKSPVFVKISYWSLHSLGNSSVWLSRNNPYTLDFPVSHYDHCFRKTVLTSKEPPPPPETPLNKSGSANQVKGKVVFLNPNKLICYVNEESISHEY